MGLKEHLQQVIDNLPTGEDLRNVMHASPTVDDLKGVGKSLYEGLPTADQVKSAGRSVLEAVEQVHVPSDAQMLSWAKETLASVEQYVPTTEQMESRLKAAPSSIMNTVKGWNR